MIARVKTSHTVNRALRIALIAPVHGVQPPMAGGSVQLVCRLAERLAARGHDVTVLGTGEPDPPPGVFYDWIDTRRSTTNRDDPFLVEALHSVNVDRLLDGSDFDVVHDHTLTGPLLVHRHQAATLHTVYGAVPDTVGVLPSGGVLRLRLIAVSDHQRTLAPNRAWLGTVHPAVAVDAYPFGGERDGSCVVLDELSDTQDTQTAVCAAHRARRSAVVVGPGSVPGRPQPVDPRLANLLVAGDALTGPQSAAQRRVALQPGDGRGAGLRNPGGGAAPRPRRRDRRARRHRLAVRPPGRARRRHRGGRRPPARGLPPPRARPLRPATHGRGPRRRLPGGRADHPLPQHPPAPGAASLTTAGRSGPKPTWSSRARRHRASLADARRASDAPSVRLSRRTGCCTRRGAAAGPPGGRRRR